MHYHFQVFTTLEFTEQSSYQLKALGSMERLLSSTSIHWICVNAERAFFTTNLYFNLLNAFHIY